MKGWPWWAGYSQVFQRQSERIRRDPRSKFATLHLSDPSQALESASAIRRRHTFHGQLVTDVMAVSGILEYVSSCFTRSHFLAILRSEEVPRYFHICESLGDRAQLRDDGTFFEETYHGSQPAG